jgi:hypothetical protein
LLAKPQSDNNEDNYNDDNDNKDVVIASESKNNDNHNVIFFAPVAVAVTVADEGVIRPCRCPLTSMPLCRRRGGDPSSSKPRSSNDNEDNDALIASMSKNNKDHIWSSSGLRMRVVLLVQPEVVAC